MKPGRYAAADGSFGRSAGAAMGRGVALLAVALLIGVVLLNKTDERPPGSDVAAGPGPATGSNGGGDDNGNGRSTTTTSTTTTVPLRQPKDVKVIVANASDVNRAAARATDQLKPPGYNVLAPTNVTPAVSTSAVYYTAGYEREAVAVATALGLPQSVVKLVPTPPPFDAKTANVLVLLGSDHASRFAAASTTTTAASGGSTGSTTTTARAASGSTTTTSR